MLKLMGMKKPALRGLRLEVDVLLPTNSHHAFLQSLDSYAFSLVELPQHTLPSNRILIVSPGDGYGLVFLNLRV
jgi:hypothetical protein